MFCPKCGADVGNAKYCPECGTKMSQIGEFSGEIGANVSTPIKKAVKPQKSLFKRWYFWALVIIILMIIAVQSAGKSAPSTSPTPDNSAADSLEDATSEELLAFDDATWPQFIELYNAHTTLVNNIQAVADGNASLVDLYQYCEDAKVYFGEKSLSFNYGESDYQKDYLQAFESMALYDQMAVDKLMDYLDSFETSDI